METFYVLRVPQWNNGPAGFSEPVLAQRGRRQGITTIEWGGGSYRAWPPTTEVVEQFKAADWYNAELYFIRTYRTLEAKMEPSGGWLSPEGKFYPCQYGQHAELASIIGAHLFGELFGTYDLLRRGWAHIYDNGIIPAKQFGVDLQLTQAQLDTLFDLSQLPGAAEDYVRGLRQMLEIARGI